MKRLVFFFTVFLATFAFGCARKSIPPQHPLTISPPETWTAGEVIKAPTGEDWWSYWGDDGLD